MDRCNIVLNASDPISMAGIASHLRNRKDIQLMPGRALDKADVFVLAADDMTDETLATLRQCARVSSARTVLITSQLREADLLAVVECRVVRVLARRDVTGDRLVAAVDAAWHWNLPPDTVLTTLPAESQRVSQDLLHTAGVQPGGFAPRETEILRLLAEGWDTAAIAEVMNYSERTVKNIVQGILSRLQLRNRAHAVAHAMRAGVI